MSIFKFFTATPLHTFSHRIHSMHSSNAFWSVHFTFCSFFYLSCWFVSYMAETAMLQFIFAAICWRINVVAQRLRTSVSRELLYVPQRDIPSWMW